MTFLGHPDQMPHQAHIIAILLMTAALAACGGGVSAVDITEPDSISIPDGSSDDASDAGDVSDAATDTTQPPRACNGLPELCGRTLDQVVFVTTHNSMSNEADFFAAPNQLGNVSTQLADGVRAFMLDTWYDNTQDPPPTDDVYLCHGACFMGMRLLSETLGEIRDFLAANPDEVVAIIFESYVSAAHTKISFDAAGVTEMLIQLDSGSPLPTMAETIDADRRILVLTDHDGGGFPGYLDVWDWSFETHWSNAAPQDFSCAPNRGDIDNPFFILNHFLTDPIASVELAGQVNFNPFFIDRANQCWTERGHRPNFVTVDFYETGDVINVVRTLNLAQQPTSR